MKMFPDYFFGNKFLPSFLLTPHVSRDFIPGCDISPHRGDLYNSTIDDIFLMHPEGTVYCIFGMNHRRLRGDSIV